MLKHCIIFLLVSLLILSCKKHPEADFKISNEEVFKGEKVFFSNTSSEATNYFWDFGDSTTSEEENPTHIYNEAGSYDVTLTVSSKNTKQQSKTQKIIKVYTMTADLMKGTWKMTEVYNDMDYNVSNTINQVYSCYIQIDDNGNITTTGIPLFLYIGFGSIDYNKIKNDLSNYLPYNTGNYTSGDIILPTNSVTQMFDMNLNLELTNIVSWNNLFDQMGINTNQTPELVEPVLYSYFTDISVEISDENKDEMIWKYTYLTESEYYYSDQSENLLLWDEKNSSDMGLTHVYFERIDSTVFQ